MNRLSAGLLTTLLLLSPMGELSLAASLPVDNHPLAGWSFFGSKLSPHPLALAMAQPPRNPFKATPHTQSAPAKAATATQATAKASVPKRVVAKANPSQSGSHNAPATAAQRPVAHKLAPHITRQIVRHNPQHTAHRVARSLAQRPKSTQSQGINALSMLSADLKPQGGIQETRLGSLLGELETPDSSMKPRLQPALPVEHAAGQATHSRQRPVFMASAAPAPVVLRSGITAQASTLDLTLGKAELLNLPSAAIRVTISNPEVAGVVVISPYQVQLVGKKIGVANLIIWSAAGVQRTVDLNVQRDVSVLAKQLRLIDPGIDISPMAAEDSVILTGEVDSPEKSQLAVELAKAFFTQSNGGPSGARVSVGPGGNNELSSQAPGSANLKPAPNVMNLIKIKGQPSTKLELVRAKLREIDPNIQLDIVPGPGGTEKAILTGRVQTPGVVSKAINTTSVFYGQPGMKLLTGPGGNLIRPMGGPEFHRPDAFSDNMDTNLLQGSVVTDTSGNVISMLEVIQKQQIRCVIKFLDLSRNDLKQLGATLTGAGNTLSGASLSGAQSSARPVAALGTLAGSQSGSGFLANSNSDVATGAVTLGQIFGSGVTQVLTLNRNMTLALSAFVEKRKIRALAEPTLTLLSGEKGSFLAGGEVPIPVSAFNGQVSVTFKEFGIRLNLIPTVTDDNKIHMKVAPEVSAVDPTFSVPTGQGISVPGFRTRRMQTTLELENGQSFVMAGLFSQDESELLNRFPGLGNVPILGAFFRQQNSQRTQNELVVVIQPEVVTVPGSAPTATSSAVPMAPQPTASSR